MERKFKIGDRIVLTKNLVDSCYNNLIIVDKGTKGTILDIDPTAVTTEPYYVEFDNVVLTYTGNKWWAHENAMEPCVE